MPSRPLRRALLATLSLTLLPFAASTADATLAEGCTDDGIVVGDWPLGHHHVATEHFGSSGEVSLCGNLSPDELRPSYGTLGGHETITLGGTTYTFEGSITRDADGLWVEGCFGPDDMPVPCDQPTFVYVPPACVPGPLVLCGPEL